MQGGRAHTRSFKHRTWKRPRRKRFKALKEEEKENRKKTICKRKDKEEAKEEEQARPLVEMKDMEEATKEETPSTEGREERKGDDDQREG